MLFSALHREHRRPSTIHFLLSPTICLSFDSFGFSYIASQPPFLLPSISCITLENTIMGAASRESVLCPRCLRIIVDGPHSFLSPTYFASHACFLMYARHSWQQVYLHHSLPSLWPFLSFYIRASGESAYFGEMALRLTMHFQSIILP